MGKEDVIEVSGTVIDTLPNAKFIVKIDEENEASEERIVTAHLSGRMRMNYIKILPGDQVTLQMSVYDLSKGRITYRQKKEKKNYNAEEPIAAPTVPESTQESTEEITDEATTTNPETTQE